MKKIFTVFLLLSLCFVQALGVTFLDEEPVEETDSEMVDASEEEENSSKVIEAPDDGEGGAEATYNPKDEDSHTLTATEGIQEGSETLSQQPSTGAQEALKEARVLAKEARETYAGVAFSIDQPLWHRTLRYLDFALTAEPNNIEALRFAVEVYADLGWHSRAWFYWERYLEVGGERDQKLAARVGEAATELGYSRYKSGDVQGALEYYQEILSKDPNNAEAIVWLARIYFEQGQPEKALPFWQTAVNKKLSKGADYFLERTQQQITYGVEASNAFSEGISFYEKGDLEAAQQEFSKATQANTNFKEAWSWLGRTSLELQQPRLAEQAWRTVTELDPDDGGAKYFLQIANEQLTWGVAAATAFREGITLYDQGSLSEANIHFVTAANHNPSYLEAIKWAARTYQEAGDNSSAIRYWQAALAIDPNDEAAKYFLSTLLSSTSYDPEANSSSLNSSPVTNSFNQGLRSYQLADFEAAKEYFLLAAKEEPSQSEAWGWLGRIHFEQGTYNKAIDYYTKALKLDPENDNFLFFAKEAKRLLKANR